MVETKEPRSAKPGTLLSQWWTLGTIVRDKRVSGRHVKVAWVIIDRYVQKKGNGQASLRYIEKFTNLNRHAVVKACRELTEWGYVTQRLGGGTRPSEYVPSWVTVRGSGAETLTTKPEIPSGVETLPTVVSELTPLETASGVETLPESYLPEPADKPASLVSSNNSAAPATPPHAAGLAPASGEAPQGEERAPEAQAGAGAVFNFDAFWNGYAHKQQRAKAKAAWVKIDPSPELATDIYTAARSWHLHYEEHGVEPRWRVLPHNWLTGEKWLEDLPLIHADAKSAAISKTRGSAKVKASVSDRNPKPAMKAKPLKSGEGFPRGETILMITAAEEVGGQTSSRLALTMTDESGVEFHHGVFFSHHKSDVQAAGQKEIDALCRAAGFFFGAPESHELVGRRLVALVDDDGLSWHVYQPPINPAVVSPIGYTAPEPPTRTAPTLDEINAADKADYDAWYEAEHEDAA